MTWRAESWVGKMLGLTQPGQPGERQIRSRGEERRTPTKYPVGFVTVRPGIREHSAVMSRTLRNASHFCVFTRNIAYSPAHPIPIAADLRCSQQRSRLRADIISASRSPGVAPRFVHASVHDLRHDPIFGSIATHIYFSET
jgi:hypothetical protein